MNKLLFPLSHSLELGKKIAELNGWEVGKSETVHFANSEIRTTVLSSVKDKNCVLVQATSNPTNEALIELLFMADSLRRGGAASIEAIIPYFGYARQNIQHRAGECVSAHVVINMLESLGIGKVSVVDIHDEGTGGIFQVPFANLSAYSELAPQIYQDLNLSAENEADCVIGSPDQGGVERARAFAKLFYKANPETDTIVVEKKRDLNAIHESKAVELFGNVKGKHVILVDDVATSGKTIMNAAKMCLDAGATAVSAAVVHADFAIGVPRLLEESLLTSFYTTNTIEKPLEDLSQYGKIKVVDISQIFNFK